MTCGAEGIVVAKVERLLEAPFARGFRRDELDRPANGISSVQGSLRTGKDLDPLNVRHRHGGTGVSRHIHVVDVNADTGIH